MSEKIIDLMRVPSKAHDLAWLKKSVQAAVELELSTIPIYLCGLWSINTDPAGIVTGLVLSVAYEEMIHLGLVCNLLTALGEVPDIVGGYQNEIVYPGGLPGGVHPGLTVYLAGLSLESVKNVFMEIELPESPLTFAATGVPTIGAFYDAISTALTQLQPTLTATNQLTTKFSGGGSIGVLATVADALAAITEIKDQGEGTSTNTGGSPYTPDFGSGIELAHYYKFSEIYYGKSLISLDQEWVYEGAAVPFPQVFPMPPIPAGGYQDVPTDVAAALLSFNTLFTCMLNGLQTAWSTGSNDTLQDAINKMFGLPAAANAIFAFPLPDGSGVYGPNFVYLPGVTSAECEKVAAAGGARRRGA